MFNISIIQRAIDDGFWLGGLRDLSWYSQGIVANVEHERYVYVSSIGNECDGCDDTSNSAYSSGLGRTALPHFCCIFIVIDYSHLISIPYLNTERCKVFFFYI